MPISRVRVAENVVHGRFMRVHHGGNPKSCDRTVEAVSSGGRQKRGHRRAPQDGVELVVEADEVLVEVEEELRSPRMYRRSHKRRARWRSHVCRLVEEVARSIASVAIVKYGDAISHSVEEIAA